MKKQLLLATLLTGMAATGYSQGTFLIDNTGNLFIGSQSPTDTSGGLFFTESGGVFTATTGNLNIDLLVSATGNTGTFADYGVVLGAAYGGADGTISSPQVTINGYGVNATPFIAIQAWIGSDTTYAAAVADGSFAGQTGGATLAGFQVAGLGGVPSSGPVVTPPALDNMPAVTLIQTPVPEPGTFALAGLGAAAMMIFRRRK